MGSNGYLHKECILVQSPTVVPGLLLEEFEQRYSVIRMWDDSEDNRLREVAPSIRALVSAIGTEVPLHLLDSLPNLGLIAINGVGADHIDIDYCRRRGIRVTNTPNVPNEDVADYAMLLTLAVLHRLCEADRFVRAGLWKHQRFPLGHKASGLKIGIMGLGHIGLAIAKRTEAFNNTVLYHDVCEKPDVPYRYYAMLSEMAADSDVLVVACPLCASTKHIVNRDVLDALGPDGVLINIARGPVIDEVALVEALQQKKLRGAGLDVFEHEPNVPEDLLRMENVILTPHLASATWETRLAQVKCVQENLEAFFAGRPLPTPLV
ncbi:hypothetical protein KP509_33G062500 [Ceratopteris richardii]|uniref:Hydroxyphenylpyruvate reductase n=1 Tax=Ceratopteris richardii TaxID=49495 RepID=A0A8T2QQT2_CERRI|nr:hypothetical protein KP509_33G062500 [Ceratopteris richardii]